MAIKSQVLVIVVQGWVRCMFVAEARATGGSGAVGVTAKGIRKNSMFWKTVILERDDAKTMMVVVRTGNTYWPPE